jgi:pyruvate ferredoxin oxidoreductase alpha subunit
VSCPLNWASEERMGLTVVQKAADCCFFPLYEVEHGLTTLSYDPEALEKKAPVSEWLKLMGKHRHLLQPDMRAHLEQFQLEVDRRWKRLKAMAEHPLL